MIYVYLLCLLLFIVGHAVVSGRLKDEDGNDDSNNDCYGYNDEGSSLSLATAEEVDTIGHLWIVPKVQEEMKESKEPKVNLHEQYRIWRDNARLVNERRTYSYGRSG